MAIETQDLELAPGVAVNMTALPDVAAEIAASDDRTAAIYVQNTGSGVTMIAERATVGRGGHPMSEREGFVLTLRASSPFWVWALTGGQVTVTGATDAD